MSIYQITIVNSCLNSYEIPKNCTANQTMEKTLFEDSEFKLENKEGYEFKGLLKHALLSRYKFQEDSKVSILDIIAENMKQSITYSILVRTTELDQHDYQQEYKIFIVRHSVREIFGAEILSVYNQEEQSIASHIGGNINDTILTLIDKTPHLEVPFATILFNDYDDTKVIGISTYRDFVPRSLNVRDLIDVNDTISNFDPLNFVGLANQLIDAEKCQDYFEETGAWMAGNIGASINVPAKLVKFGGKGINVLWNRIVDPKWGKYIGDKCDDLSGWIDNIIGNGGTDKIVSKIREKVEGTIDDLLNITDSIEELADQLGRMSGQGWAELLCDDDNCDTPSLYDRDRCNEEEEEPPSDEVDPDIGGGVGDMENGKRPPIVDPLVLDLIGDGIYLTSLNQSDAYFDLDDDGHAEKTGWITNGLGILAIDKNNNGTIDDIHEIFGNQDITGFIELRNHDSDENGVINNADIDFSSLVIWQDSNQNGITEPGELSSLITMGITELPLKAIPIDMGSNGNLIIEYAHYKKEDGSTGKIYEVLFAMNQFESKFVGDGSDHGGVAKHSLLLPHSRGYGELMSWQLLSTNDAFFKNMLRDLSKPLQGTLCYMPDKFLEFLFEWSKCQDVAPDSRGEFFDGQKLCFLEKMTGSPYTLNGGSSDPNLRSANFLNAGWSKIYDTLYDRIMFQGIYKNYFEAEYHWEKDAVNINNNIDDVLFNLNKAVFDISKLDDVVCFFETFLNLIKKYYKENSSAQKVADFIAEKLDIDFNSSTNIYSFSGSQGVIKASDGNNLIVASVSDMRLEGGANEDTYVYSKNALNLTILEKGGENTLLFPSDIEKHDIILSVLRSGLQINILPHSAGIDLASILIEKFFDCSNGINAHKVSTLKFHTGDVKIKTDEGLGGDPCRNNKTHDNYHYERGDEDMMIIDMGGKDTISLGQDITKEDLVLKKLYDSLIISITGSENSPTGHITIANHFYQKDGKDKYKVEKISFADGSEFDLDSYIPQHIEGSDQDDILFGNALENTIIGKNGNDTLHGLLGDDSLEGGFGDDIYVYNRGDGNDEIYDIGGKDTISFGQDIGLDDIKFKQEDKSLILNITARGDLPLGSVKIVDYFLDNVSSYKIETIRFADGSEFDLESYVPQHIEGSDQDDILFGNALENTIIGKNGNDTLHGLLGDDRLEGGFGDDIYVYNRGDGNDEIYDIGGKDTISFGQDIGLDDIKFKQEDKSLILNITARGDLPLGSVKIVDYFLDNVSSYKIEKISLAENNDYDLSELLNTINDQQSDAQLNNSGNNYILWASILTSFVVISGAIYGCKKYYTSIEPEPYEKRQITDYITDEILHKDIIDKVLHEVIPDQPWQLQEVVELTNNILMDL